MKGIGLMHLLCKFHTHACYIPLESYADLNSLTSNVQLGSLFQYPVTNYDCLKVM